MLRVGLIGCGGMGSVHATVWSEMTDKAELVAVADLNQDKWQRFADKLGAKFYTDAYDMMEKEDLDVVDICTPTVTHTLFATTAAEHVKHVIVEKPICLYEEEAQLLLKAEKEYGVTMHMAHVVRFNNQSRYLKKLVDTGIYGKIITADFHRLSPDPTWVVDHNNPAKTGGMAIDLHIHDVDLIRFLMGGDPDAINSTVHTRPDETIDHVWSCYKYGDATVSCEASWDYPASMPFDAGFRVRFEKATVLSAPDRKVMVYPEDGEPFMPEFEETESRDLGINIKNIGDFKRELGCFANAIIDGKKESPVPLSEAIAALRLIRHELNEANIH